MPDRPVRIYNASTFRVRESESPRVTRVQAGRKRVERDSDGFSGTDKKWQRLLGIGQGAFCISVLLEERNAAHATPLLLQMRCEVKQTTCQLTSAGCAQAAYAQRPGATCAALGLSQSRFCCEDKSCVSCVGVRATVFQSHLQRLILFQPCFSCPHRGWTFMLCTFSFEVHKEDPFLAFF